MCSKSKNSLFDNELITRKYPVLPREISYEHILPSKLSGMTIAQYLELCMKRYAKRIALKIDKYEFTYEAVYNDAKKIAYALIENKCDEDETVALLFEHGSKMIIGMVGALLSGRRFICLDPTAPVNRLRYIVEDANIKTVITSKNNEFLANELNSLADNKIKILFSESIKKDVDWEHVEKLHVEENDIAFLLYTSGSSGMPKGVIQTHRNVLFHIASYINSLCINRDDKVALLTNYTHAVAMIDVLSTFFTGAMLLPYDVRSLPDASKLYTWLQNEEITVYHSVPTVYRFMMRDLNEGQIFNHLRLVVLGGESVNYQDWAFYDKHCNENCVFVNFFGSSEVMTASFGYTDHQNKPHKGLLPIGHFVEGVNVILKDGDRIAHELEVGEIVYESEFITPGYWKKSQTIESGNIQERNGIRIFYSGDLGRFMPDGQMQYLGRNDNMVKINGNRVELAEIEANLVSLLPIDQCVTVAVSTEQCQNTLVAYYTTRDKKELNKKDAINILRKSLPNYMIPAKMIFLESFPMTANGKIDRMKINQLAKQNEKSIHREFNDIEKKLEAIWKKVLNVHSITLEDNFIQSGGNSLHIFSLINEIVSVFGINTTVSEIYEVLNFEDMALFIQKRIDEKLNLSLSTQQIKTDMLTKVDGNDYYPLSGSQRRIFYHMAHAKSDTAYNQSLAFTVQGNLDINKVNFVFQQLIQRHDMLRASICMINGEPMQHIKSNVYINVEVHQCDEENISQKINDFIRPFNISEPPLMRVGVLKICDNKNILIIDIHHIIADGTSVKILLDEFIELYNGGTLPESKFDYIDYVCRHKEIYNNSAMQKHMEYWQQKFAQPVSPLVLPQLPVQQGKKAVQASVHFDINALYTQSLHNFSIENNTSLFTILLTVFYILLYRYSAQEDLIVCVPVAGRGILEQRQMVGMFINMLPIRCNINGEKSIIDIVKEVRSATLQAFDHQEVPFEQIVENVQGQNHTDYNAVFNILFVLQNMNINMNGIPGLNITRYNIGANNTAYDISFEATEDNDSIHFMIKYNPLRLSYEFIQGMAAHYLEIVKQLILNPHVIISDFPIITDTDKEKLQRFNDTTAEYPSDKTVNELFEEQVIKFPEQTALIYQNTYMSYYEFNKRANQIAAFLLERKVKQNPIIGVMLKRSPWMPLAIMAILKAGGAYLPISPDYPVSRISYMLKDSNVDTLLTDSDAFTELDYTGEVIFLDKMDVSGYDGTKDISVGKPESLAYVIYTSGTKGLPKGVAVSHRSAINMINWMQSEFHISSSNVILFKTPYVFDASLRELFWWCMFGATLCILEHGDEKDPVKIVEAINRNRVTHINFVPSMFNEFLRYLEDNPSAVKKVSMLENVFCCGEPLTASMVKRFYNLFPHSSKPVLCNLYGPTETTIDVTYYICDKQNIPDIIPIGKPIYNTKIYIVNKYKHLQPIGVIGELCAAGDCVSEGYINNPELTNQKFIENPFEACGKMYCTGDMARWLPDGTIQYLGRMDDQIKINGYRIELDEIRKNLVKIKDIKEAIVLAHEDNEGNKFLCAYCIFNKEMTVAQIRQELIKQLPEYMIPARYVSISSIPTNINGKLDKQKLPEPITNIPIGTMYCAPENKMQKILADLWCKILNVERVGINDNFFHLGGNSIKTLQVVSRLQHEYDINLSLKDIYNAATINELAQLMRKKENKAFDLKKAEHNTHYPLSSAQKRIFLSSMLKSSIYDDNNATFAFYIEGEVDFNKLESVFKTIITRHEILRTSYFIKDGDPVQKVHTDFKFNLHRVQADYANLESIINNFNVSFNLEEPPLIRVMVATLTSTKHVLCICVHHIAFDGFSTNVLIKELSALYQGYPLPDLDYQYKDYAVWQNEIINSEEMQSHKEYWMKQFSKIEHRDELFLDYPRPDVIDFHGESIMFSLSKELTDKLNDIANDLQASLFMVTFSIYIILLNKYIGSNDITVGIPAMGRPIPELEQMIGMFVNTLPIRVFPHENKSYCELLKEVKEVSLNAFEHQDYQYDMLVRALDLKPDLGRNAIFDTMFAFQNIIVQDLEIEGLQIKQYPVKNQQSVFDIVLYIYDGEILEGKLTYSEKLFKKSTMELFIKDYLRIAEQVCNNPYVTIKEIATEYVSKKKQNNKLNDIVIDFDF